MGLFLPFTPAAKATERRAIEIKRRLGLGAYVSVDPFEVLEAIPARLISLDVFPPDVRAQLTGHRRAEWSAIGYGRSPITGEELILLNPTHHEHRQRASLMEELVHIVFDHPKVALRFEENGGWRRPYEKKAEDEAFNVGAACVIPYKWLFKAIQGNTAAARIAEQVAVSEGYVEYRIKRAGLYRMYRSHCING